MIDVCGKREEFVSRCATTVSRLFSVDGYAATTLKREDAIGDFVSMDGIATADSTRRYGYYWRNDPCFPSREIMVSERVVTLCSVLDRSRLPHSEYYDGFMAVEGFSDFLECAFVVSGVPVGAITFIRRGRVFLSEEANMLRTIWEMIEFGAGCVFPQLGQQMDYVPSRFDLTPRERDIVNLIKDGKSNKEISRELTIGLPTVKTHLIHIFQKVGVNNRTALLSSMYAI